MEIGDIVFTTNGAKDPFWQGLVWKVLGKFIKGNIDHCLIYIGNDKFVEAGINGVIEFDTCYNKWNSTPMRSVRGMVDTVYGIGSPVDEIHRNVEGIKAIGYCNFHLGKSYNYKFWDYERDDKFYCSQLVYKAYKNHFKEYVDLKRGKIIYPQDLWNMCIYKQKV